MSPARSVGLALLFLLQAAVMQAQPAPPVPLTLAEAVSRALETSHRLAEVLARHEGAEAAVQARRAADQPTVAVSGGYIRTNHFDEFGVTQPNGMLRVIYPDIPDNYFTRVSLQWPIYTGGRTDALERAALAEARATTAEAEIARADLRLEVERAYWALATATESISVLEEAVARAETHLRDVRTRFDVGLVPPNEVSSVEAERSRQQVQLIEARNFRSGVVEDLRRLTGVTTDIRTADPLTPSGSRAAAETLTIARPEQQALKERLVAADERVQAAAAGRRPTVAFTGAADYANPNRFIFPRAARWRTSWELGVTANWTLWDGGRVDAEAAEAGAAARAARERLADLDAHIATEVRQRQLDVESARAALSAAEDAVRSAAEARRVVAERFNVGVATNTDALDAQVALLQASLERTRALANIRLSEARLRRAQGH